jgi:hypothetical protein
VEHNRSEPVRAQDVKRNSFVVCSSRIITFLLVQYVASNAWPNRLSTLLQRMVAQFIKILSPIDARYGQAIL